MADHGSGGARTAGVLPPGGWTGEVLAFWFEDHAQSDWFQGGANFDDKIRTRFDGLVEAVAGLDRKSLIADARTALAAVVVLDQFPRNLYRDSAKQFAFDEAALALANDAISLGLDAGMTVDQRLFLYLPFEHSEDVGDQDKAVALIGALANADYTEFAEKHRDLIRRFGRFPHRNALLGRSSTPEETAFLSEHGRGF